MTHLEFDRPDESHTQTLFNGQSRDLEIAKENKELKTEIMRLRLKLAETEKKANTDALCDVFNRRAFMSELERVCAMHERYSMTSCLIFMDLNGFKIINDTFGHLVGDKMLKTVSRTLLENVRTFDSIGRLGGDEFGIILFNSEQAMAERRIEVLNTEISALSTRIQGADISMSASWGLVTTQSGVNAGNLLAQADAAMYDAKLHAKTRDAA